MYVDDIICAHNDEQLFAAFRKDFLERFNGKHLGKLSWFLGMAVDQHADGSITINQNKSVSDLVKKYCPDFEVNGIKHALPGNSELFTPGKLQNAKDDIERARVAGQPHGFMSIVGSLLYVACMSRPDILYYVTLLCKHMQDPSMECYRAAMGVVHYLGAHPNFEIRFDVNWQKRLPAVLDEHKQMIVENSGLHAYSDSSWAAGNEVFPMFGYVVFLCGGMISFAAKNMTVVAQSSCEAEYVATAYTCKELDFVRNLCSELDIGLSHPAMLMVDNSAAIDIIKDRGVSGRTKHFNLGLHYTRNAYEERKVLPLFVRTKNQAADWFTKGLDKTTFLTWFKFYQMH